MWLEGFILKYVCKRMHMYMHTQRDAHLHTPTPELWLDFILIRSGDKLPFELHLGFVQVFFFNT